jgi:hypothetical protein
VSIKRGPVSFRSVAAALTASLLAASGFAVSFVLFRAESAGATRPCWSSKESKGSEDCVKPAAAADTQTSDAQTTDAQTATTETATSQTATSQTTTSQTTTTQTTTTQTTAAAPAGSVLFADGFDNRSFANWDYMQASCRYGSSSSLIDGFVPGMRQGGYAARFHLRQGIRSDVASGNEACEVTKRTANYRLGQTDYYAMRFRIVGPYTMPYQWGMIHQLAYPTLMYANLATDLRQQLTTYGANGYWSGTSYQHVAYDLPVSTISADHWHELIWEVKWATGTSGSLRIWHRRDGAGDWTKVYEETNIPTHQYGQSIYSCITKEGKNCTDGSDRTVLNKIGIYRGHNPNGQPDTIVDHDAFIIGTSFQTVADKLAGS